MESQGIRCWIAPRDVPLGTEYADSIVDAIESCQVMVLVFSANANASHQVRREVERAVSKGITIVPVRIEDAEMSKSFELYVSSMHWLDAITPPLERHIDKLARDLKALLSKGDESPAPPALAPRAEEVSRASAPIPSATPTPAPTPASGGSGLSPRSLAIGALAVLVLVFAVWAMRRGGDSPQKPKREATPAASSPEPSRDRPAREAVEPETPPAERAERPPAQAEPASQQPPVAAFELDRTLGLAPLVVTVRNRSQGKIESHQWDFGDGGTATRPELRYRYAKPGRYTVTLTVRGPGGADRAYKKNVVTVGEKPPQPRTSDEAIHRCMAVYSRYGQCDWDHWTEMYEWCRLAKFSRLGDRETIEQVRAGKCQWDNWSSFATWLSKKAAG